MCNAERVIETHPMAKILGTVEDLEDLKQKIEKQKALKHKTLNKVKAYLPVEEVKFIETQMLEDNKIEPPAPKKRLINGRPIFKNNFEKLCQTKLQNLDGKDLYLDF